ncbi:MAG TPA: SbcC/MukB-like Walker B domain-containing protein, partial [Streptosporangiaceae bacterium]|nr:SbcC/MukB-like Walker B domain-containing protein [Streptosporangiaceae bacterium]
RPLLAGLIDAQAAAGEARAALIEVAREPDGDMLAGRGGSAAAARAEDSEREAAGLQYLAGREKGLAAQETELAALELTAEQASAQVTALEEARNSLPGRISRLAGEWQQLRAVAAGLAALLSRREAVMDKHRAASGAAELAPEVAVARSALQAAVDAHQALVGAHQGLYETRLSEMAAELAAQLGEGCPCPVCGSTEHPMPACPSPGAVSASDIEEATARRDRAGEERTRLDAEYTDLVRREAALIAQAGGCAAGDLAAEAEALTSEIVVAEQATADADRLEAELATARGELETSVSDLREAEKQATAAGEQVRVARESLDGIRSELEAAAGLYPSVAGRQAGLQEAADRDRALAHALDKLSAALDGEAKTRDRAEREAERRGFADLDAAREAVLAAGEVAELDSKVESWKSTLADLEAATRIGDLAGLDLSQADQIYARTEAAAAELTRAQSAEQEVRRAHDAALVQAERLRRRAVDVREAEEAYDQIAERAEPVIRLAGLAKGTEGHRRVSLTTYVLRHWFSQVVTAANVRLAAMSSGRYELKRTDEGGTRRERAGLTLAVIDRHTGTERSPASLSGGETFYTSLALALGLADVVKAEAGGVDLDTLFIDEGFGSLDAGTLDEVMAVIDDLRDRGRVVGIVSHVADLKDRVPERLEVRRLPDGSSAVKVVA